MNYIPLDECRHGGLYKIHARNFYLGVFNFLNSGFIGVREKFGNKFLFTEFHWDTGPPFGTVKPIKLIEECPVEDIFDLRLDESVDPPCHRENHELFEYLNNKVDELFPKHEDKLKEYELICEWLNE